jgi:hypothetical protein
MPLGIRTNRTILFCKALALFPYPHSVHHHGYLPDYPRPFHTLPDHNCPRNHGFTSCRTGKPARATGVPTERLNALVIDNSNRGDAPNL